MTTTYFPEDDIPEIRLSDQQIVREVSHGWNTNISYAADGSIVEIVLLDARKQGLVPVQMHTAPAHSAQEPRS
ncbi:MAG: DUF2283 domain-containing protein [Burkholderiales bacterium]